MIVVSIRREMLNKRPVDLEVVNTTTTMLFYFVSLGVGDTRFFFFLLYSWLIFLLNFFSFECVERERERKWWKRSWAVWNVIYRPELAGFTRCSCSQKWGEKKRGWRVRVSLTWYTHTLIMCIHPKERRSRERKSKDISFFFWLFGLEIGAGQPNGRDLLVRRLLRTPSTLMPLPYGSKCAEWL